MKKQKDILRKSAEAPAVLLDRTISSTQKMATVLPDNPVVKKTTDYWGALGPGLTTGAADDDPSGIATYSQAGAQFGYALTWTMALTLPFMAAIQIISALIGWHTKKGLAANIAKRLPRPVLLLLVALL